MKLRRWLVAGIAAFVLACGGGPVEEPAPAPSPQVPAPANGRPERGRKAGGRKAGGGAPEPAVNSPANRTFESADGKRIVFTSTRVKKTWSNMVGPPVDGQWSQSGATVEVKYVPAENHGSTAETFFARSECVLTRTARIDATTGERIESPLDYVLDDPACRR